MRLESKEDFERARERLRRRDADSLAEFLMSLATQSGPVGKQVRTFIAGDNLAETVESLKDRIDRLAIASEYEHRHSLGREMGESLDFIVDSIERLVLPIDAKAAVGLLVAVFEADAVAMENCGDHDWDVACAYRRATEVMAQAAQKLPRAEVEKPVKGLIERDGYGLRARLASVFVKDPR